VPSAGVCLPRIIDKIPQSLLKIVYDALDVKYYDPGKLTYDQRDWAKAYDYLSKVSIAATHCAEAERLSKRAQAALVAEKAQQAEKNQHWQDAFESYEQAIYLFEEAGVDSLTNDIADACRAAKERFEENDRQIRQLLSRIQQQLASARRNVLPIQAPLRNRLDPISELPTIIEELKPLIKLPSTLAKDVEPVLHEVREAWRQAYLPVLQTVIPNAELSETLLYAAYQRADELNAAGLLYNLEEEQLYHQLAKRLNQTHAKESETLLKKAQWYLDFDLRSASENIYSLVAHFSTKSASSKTIALGQSYSEITLRLIGDGFYILDDENIITCVLHEELSNDFETSFRLQAYPASKNSITIEITGNDVILDTTTLTAMVTLRSGKVKPELSDPVGLRTVPQPDLVLRVYRQPISNSHFRLEYVLYSTHPNLHLTGISVRSIEVPVTRLMALRPRLERLLYQHQDTGLRAGLNAVGRELYTLLFSPGEDGLAWLYNDIADRIQSWLILDDAGPWIPWELVKPHGPGWEHDFLGAHYALGRWIEGWGALRQPEFPLGQVCFAQDTAIEQSVEAWTHLLTSDEVPRLDSAAPDEGLFVDWPGGYPAALDYTSPVWGLHFEGYPDRLSRSLTTLAVRDEAWLSTETLRDRWLDLHHKTPLVTFGMQSVNHQTALTDVESKWMPTFIRAGASAFISALWATSPQADWLFWRAFYQAIWQRVPLGEAVLQARQYVRQAMPDSMDWLAYFLVGDPMARGYIPSPSEGYTALECINHDLEQPFRIRRSYKFRVSLRMTPPPWYHERRYKSPEYPWGAPHVFVFAHSFKLCTEPLLPLRSSGGDIMEATFELIPQRVGEHDIFVKFMDGDAVRQTLSFNIKVTDEEMTK